MTQAQCRETCFRVIFGTDTPAGRNFDILLIVAILLSVIAIIFDSLSYYNTHYGSLLFGIEWVFTGLFTIEYLVRLYCSPKPWRYVFSFYGLVDLMAILPTYFNFLFPTLNYLLIIRLLRVLRVFRVLHLFSYLTEADLLVQSMKNARKKVAVFFLSIFVVIVIFGALMFIIEGHDSGFTSIPESIYWAVVTVTTVGYGDITPHTVLGQIVAAMAMLTGYAIIVVPTGIVSAEVIAAMQQKKTAHCCPHCDCRGHDHDAQFCKFCGGKMG